MTTTFSYGFYYAPGVLDTLRSVVKRTRYKPGWSFDFKASAGDGPVSLVIEVETIHSETGEPFPVAHHMPIPPIPYSAEEWERWVLEQILLVERHEACEFFEVGGQRPFYPEHGEGAQPYKIERG